MEDIGDEGADWNSSKKDEEGVWYAEMPDLREDIVPPWKAESILEWRTRFVTSCFKPEWEEGLMLIESEGEGSSSSEVENLMRLCRACRSGGRVAGEVLAGFLASAAAPFR
jgi:hypothetical protein